MYILARDYDLTSTHYIKFKELKGKYLPDKTLQNLNFLLAKIIHFEEENRLECWSKRTTNLRPAWATQGKPAMYERMSWCPSTRTEKNEPIKLLKITDWMQPLACTISINPVKNNPHVHLIYHRFPLNSGRGRYNFKDNL